MSTTKTDKMYQQLFCTVTSTTSTSDWVTGEIAVPIGISNVIGKTGRCIEVLKITIQNATAPFTNAQNHWVSVGVVDLTGKNTSNYSHAIMAMDPRVIRWIYGIQNSYDELQFQDNKGNGLLIPGDRLFININNSTSTANTFRITLSYRVKNVPLSEYLGLVNQFTANV